MSRSGYIDDIEDELAFGRWRGAVLSSLRGARGQAMLRELIQALDEMPVKELYPGSFTTADGEFCALGVVGTRRGTKMDDLGDESDCDPKLVGQRFGISHAMAAEIMYMNDEFVNTEEWVEVEICGPMRGWVQGRSRREQHKRFVRVQIDGHAALRWKAVRDWAQKHLKDPA